MSTIIYDESTLWVSFSSGDEKAFSLLYKMSYPKLYSYGISLGLEDESIRDIIQELFIKLYTNPGLIKNSSTLKSFLFVSVRNAFVNYIKYKQKHLNYQRLDSFEFPYSVENTKLEDEEELKLIKERVDSIIKSLTPRQREIIYLRFLQQMEYEEISKIMDMSEQAARNLIYRAIEKARKNNTDLALFLIIISKYFYIN